ncbi:hypothetical protein PG995_000554 [Apiospora arundinis]
MVSATWKLTQKLAEMSFNDQNKTRHQSKLLYRKDHTISRQSSNTEQIKLPDTFSPALFDPFWKGKLPATHNSNIKTEVTGEHHISKDGLKGATIEAAQSKIQAAARSDPTSSNGEQYWHNSAFGPASKPKSESKKCIECGKFYVEEDNTPNACNFHWAMPTQEQHKSPPPQLAAQWPCLGMGLLWLGPQV